MLEIHIFLINRYDRPKRLLSTLETLRKSRLSHNITRIEACTPERAKSLKYNYLNLSAFNNITNYDRKDTLILPSWGSLGCAISHKWVWNNILKFNLDYALIIEDDLDFSGDDHLYVIKEAIDIIEQNKNNPLCILFGSESASIENTLFGTHSKLGKINGIFTGLHCYMLNRIGAKYLNESIKQFTYQLDIHIGLLAQKEYSKNNNLFNFICLNYSDCGVRQKKTFDSDIQIIEYNFKSLEPVLNQLPSSIILKIIDYLPKKINSLLGDYYNYYSDKSPDYLHAIDLKLNNLFNQNDYNSYF